MNTIRKTTGGQLFRLGSLMLGVVIFGFAPSSFAAPIVCRSTASTVKAVTDPDYHAITTRFQFDSPNLQPILSTTISVSGTGYSCIIAHLSAMARITDNYIVFQVRVNRVPMDGHLSSIPAVPGVPVVFTSLDETSQSQDEQLSDPIKMVSYNFFKKVVPGTYTIQVFVAAGSNIDPTNPPMVGSPVLTLEYR